MSPNSFKELIHFKIRHISIVAVATCGLFAATSPTYAAGVDNAVAPFQMEGDATKTAAICFGTDADSQPAIADVVGGDCPDVTGFLFEIVNFGADSDDWSDTTHSIVGRSHEDDLYNSQNDNSFLGSASKDTMDISQWSWTASKPQGKSDIVNALAAAYTVGSDTYIYAALDRWDNSGSTTAGFWFVQDSAFAICTGAGVSSDGPNPACTASGTFLGHHTNDDMLIVSDFSQGGAVATILVYSWQNGSLVLEASRSPAPCNPVTDGNDLCGAVNNKYALSTDRKGNTILVPTTVAPPTGVTYSGKGGNTAYEKGEFLEIGVNLSAIFDNVPCFSKFMAETRSSTSVEASLSDLTTPVSFPLCSLNVTKSCDSSAIMTDNGTTFVRYNFSGTINNTGSSTIYHPNLKDVPPSAGYIANSLKIDGNSATPNTFIDLEGSIVGGASRNYSGTLDSTVILSGTGDSALNKVFATASSDPSGTPQNVGPDEADWGNPDSCAPNVAPGLSLSKKCATCLVSNGNDLDVDVSEGVKICNTGNVAISGIVIKDCRGGVWNSNDPATATCSGDAVTLSGPTSLAANTCAVINDSFTPVDCDSRTGTPQNGQCSFSDAVIASGTAALSGATVTAQQASGSCNVCGINNTCPTYTSDDF
jgi:hypothetical protein